MKTIIIQDYPTDMCFKVRKELPEFTFNCPVRNKILHYQLKKQKVDSPCHAYSDYGVEFIEQNNVYNEVTDKFEDIEYWEIGS